MEKFQVGDKVNWCGLVGIVVKDDNADSKYLVRIDFKMQGNQWFTTDSRLWSFHTEPSLKIIEKAKKKVKKWQWMYKYDGKYYASSYYYKDICSFVESIPQYGHLKVTDFKRIDESMIEVEE